MKFTKESALVKVWVANVENELYTLEQIPALYNLRDIVIEVLEDNETI